MLPDVSRVALPGVNNQSAAAGLASGRDYIAAMEALVKGRKEASSTKPDVLSTMEEPLEPAPVRSPGIKLRDERRRLAEQIRAKQEAPVAPPTSRSMDEAPLPTEESVVPSTPPTTFSTPALDPPLPGEEVTLFPTSGQDSSLLLPFPTN